MGRGDGRGRTVVDHFGWRAAKHRLVPRRERRQAAFGGRLRVPSARFARRKPRVLLDQTRRERRLLDRRTVVCGTGFRPERTCAFGFPRPELSRLSRWTVGGLRRV